MEPPPPPPMDDEKYDPINSPAPGSGRPPSSISSSKATSTSVTENNPLSDKDLEAGIIPVAAAPVRATTSAAGTGRSAAVPVPRAKRRGLLGSVTLIPEVEVPTDYSDLVKNLITIVVAAGGAGAPMASAILYPALTQISEELHSSQTITNLSIALYMLAMAIFPLWWSAAAERTGRRTVYIISFALYVASSICAAESVNIGMLIAFRVASGATAASLQAVGAGTISDIYEVQERGRAMGYFYLGPLCGPLLSPIVGGALTQRFGWRSTQWFLAIYGVVELLLMIFCLPETLRHKPSAAQRLSTTATNATASDRVADGELVHTLSRVSTRTRIAARTWLTATREIVIDPLKALRFMQYPPVALTVTSAALTFGCLYVLNVSIQETYARAPYNFSTLIVGLCYIPGSLGYVLASILGGKWTDHIMRAAALKRRDRMAAAGEVAPDAPLQYRPEDRMGINAWVAGLMYPLALIWYGWMVQKGVFWFVPMMATFMFGIGSMLVFSMATTMLTEFVPGRSASAVAVNNFVRNIFSCVGGFVAEPALVAIGNGWLMTILAFLGMLTLFAPLIMHRYGPMWREQANSPKYRRVLQ